MTLKPEADEIVRAAAGDQRALAALIDRHSPRVYALAKRMLTDAEEAEDVTQEVFLRAWRALPRWEPRARLSTWLHRVGLNLCYDRLRRRREQAMSEPPEQIDPGLRPDQAMMEVQRQARVGAAIDGLPARQKAAITLCAIEGRSNIEAAEIMDISVEALESLLARARRGLRTTLADAREDEL